MKIKQAFCVLAITMLVVGCGGAERKAHRSEAKVNEERLKLIDDYQDCVDDAGDNAEEAEACETLRKSAEALK